MKTYSLIIILGLCCSAMKSQEPTFQFTYDQGGNLIERKVQSLMSARMAPLQHDTIVSDTLLHFSVYPNPSNDVINIEEVIDVEKEDYSKFTYKLVALNGQIVCEEVKFTGNIHVKVSHLAEGMYFLVIENEEREKAIYHIIISK